MFQSALSASTLPTCDFLQPYNNLPALETTPAVDKSSMSDATVTVIKPAPCSNTEQAVNHLPIDNDAVAEQADNTFCKPNGGAEPLKTSPECVIPNLGNTQKPLIVKSPTQDTVAEVNKLPTTDAKTLSLVLSARETTASVNKQSSDATSSASMAKPSSRAVPAHATEPFARTSTSSKSSPQLPSPDSSALPAEVAIGTNLLHYSRRVKPAETLAKAQLVNGKTRPRSPDNGALRGAPNKKKRRVEANASLSNGDSSPTDSQSTNDLSRAALLRISTVARQKNVVWTKIKGHPFWPTQIVDLTPELEEEHRFKQALRFHRKGESTCVMYFGTCEIAFVNQERACVAWDNGVRRGLHTAHKARPMFRRALLEVKAFCSRATRFPRGWWNEPDVLVLYSEFIEKAADAELHPDVRPACIRADKEIVCWSKVRGFPHWPVQVLPRNMAAENYPELKIGTDSEHSSSLPCMFFGTAEVAMVPDKNLTPFLAGISRGYLTDSDRHDFVVAVGEVWGYLKKPRIWPSGYLSRKSWWNFVDNWGRGGRSDSDSSSACVPYMPHYEHIKKSVWGDGVEPIPKPKKGDIACCDCLPGNKREDKCVDSTCLNFASNFLCSASCQAGAFCKNVNFHKRKSPKMTPFFTADQRGWGMKVDEFVSNGSFVIEYVGEIIDREVLEKRLKTMDKEKSTEYYMMDLTNDLLVDAKFKGNFSRFINSSCEPNCQTQKWTDPSTGQTHVCIFAIRDIQPGTELTYNYCFLDFGLSGKRGKRSFSCQCGTPSCCMLQPVEQELMRRYIGKRIEVRWDDGWYPGVVELYNRKRKRFRVQYDDGDCEDLVLGLPIVEKDDDVPFRLVEDSKSVGSDSKSRGGSESKSRSHSDSRGKSGDSKNRNSAESKVKAAGDSRGKPVSEGKVDLKKKHGTEGKSKHGNEAKMRRS